MFTENQLLEAFNKNSIRKLIFILASHQSLNYILSLLFFVMRKLFTDYFIG